MKGTENFKKVIKEYLDGRAQSDELFAQSYAKEGKSLEECVKYILSEVQKSGMNGFDDAEIFGMAVHYYDEDNLGPISDVGDGSVVVNHHIELSEEEKAEAREKAIKEYQQSIKDKEAEKAREQAEKEKARKQARLEELKKQEESQPSLFDL